MLLATAIFSICMSAIYASFRTASRSFEVARRSAEATQSLRFTTDRITRDLRTVFFETGYNQRYLDLCGEMQKRENEILESLEDKGTIDFEIGGFPPEGDSGRDDEEVPFLCMQSNLRFLGDASKIGSSIEFAHSLPNDGSFEDSFMGVERVRYFLGGREGTNLYRQRSRVVSYLEVNPDLEEEILQAREARAEKKAAQERRDAGSGSRVRSPLARRKDEDRSKADLPDPDEPEFDVDYLIRVPEESFPPELLAENVVEFRLLYGYFFGEWIEAETWDSEGKEHRTAAFNVPEDDIAYLNKLVAYRHRTFDLLPSYVRVELAVRDSAGSKKKAAQYGAEKMESTVWLPAAVENYVPSDSTLFEPTPEKEEDR